MIEMEIINVNGKTWFQGTAIVVPNWFLLIIAIVIIVKCIYSGIALFTSIKEMKNAIDSVLKQEAIKEVVEQDGDGRKE